MTTANKIIANRSNPVVLNVRVLVPDTANPDGPPIVMPLSDFTRIEAAFGEDVRNTVDDPESIRIVGSTRLELYFGSTTETSSNYWRITGFTASDTEGLDIVSRCVTPDVGPTSVCT